MVTKTRQVAQRAKVEGGGVALTGRMWWNLVDVGLAGVFAGVGQACCTKSDAQAQGLGPPIL